MALSIAIGAVTLMPYIAFAPNGPDYVILSRCLLSITCRMPLYRESRLWSKTVKTTSTSSNKNRITVEGNVVRRYRLQIKVLVLLLLSESTKRWSISYHLNRHFVCGHL